MEQQRGLRGHRAGIEEAAHQAVQDRKTQGDRQQQAHRAHPVVDQGQADAQAGKHQRQETVHRAAHVVGRRGPPQSQAHQHGRQQEEVVTRLA
ncbi:hypothetical protein D3C71_1422970 [compost metagenome]